MHRVPLPHRLAGNMDCFCRACKNSPTSDLLAKGQGIEGYVDNWLASFGQVYKMYFSTYRRSRSHRFTISNVFETMAYAAALARTVEHHGLYRTLWPSLGPYRPRMRQLYAPGATRWRSMHQVWQQTTTCVPTFNKFIVIFSLFGLPSTSSFDLHDLCHTPWLALAQWAAHAKKFPTLDGFCPFPSV